MSIYIDEKIVNPKQVVWIGDIREVKRSTPKVKDGDTKVELPPVYNFMVNVGIATLKSADFESKDDAHRERLSILDEVLN